MRTMNSLKTLGLFAVMWAIVLGIGSLLSWSTHNSVWIFISGGLGLILTLYTYWNSAKLALKQMRAYQVTREQAPHLYIIVEELSARARMPMPSIWIAPTETPNAFATGRNPKNAAVCCTEGILQLLDERQLRGVLGHELMHVYNRDILTSSVAAAMGGIVATLAEFLLFSKLFGGDDEESDNGGILGLIVQLLAIFLMPLVASLVQLAISRTREYSADHDGAALTGDPLALASALRALEAETQRNPLNVTPGNENVAALMIANPFSKSARRLASLFSTHPPMDERVARLEYQAQAMGHSHLPPI